MITRFLLEALRRSRSTVAGARRLRAGHFGREPILKGDERQTTEAGGKSSQY